MRKDHLKWAAWQVIRLVYVEANFLRFHPGGYKTHPYTKTSVGTTLVAARLSTLIATILKRDSWSTMDHQNDDVAPTAKFTILLTV